MPRLIILLLTSAALTTLTLQNRGEESAVPLVIAGQTIVERMPLGFLLLLSVAVGALLTLILYGLVSVGKPATSKYQPIGRRVPYPDGPSGGSSSPSSSPRSPDSPGTGFTPQDSKKSSYSGSSAFVSEPSSPKATSSSSHPISNPRPASNPTTEPAANPQPFIDPPRDTPPTSDSTKSQYRNNAPYSASSYSDSSYSDAPYSDASYLDSSYSETQPSRSASTSRSKSRFIEQPIAGLKSVFGKKKDHSQAAEAEMNRPVGDDWGELRTTEQRNSWNTEKETSISLEEGAKGLLNFGRNVGANASRLAEDIASGWNEQRSGRADDSSYRQYSDDQYSDGQYSDNQYSDGYYQTSDNDLDQGWPSSDGYSDRSPGPPAYNAADKRTYGDSLYSSRSDGLEGAYPVDDFDDGLDDVGPDDVYEADYRVIEPPKKPLSDINPGEIDSDDMDLSDVDEEYRN